MKFQKIHLLLFLACGLSAIVHVNGISCKRPTVGRYVVSTKDGLECVALVKEMCIGMKTKNTRTWKRGVNVKENCPRIRPMSAIATFSGPHAKYGGGPFKHAAIFSSCDSEGIWIFDQWNGSRGVRYRQLKYDQENQNGGQNYYTVVV